MEQDALPVKTELQPYDGTSLVIQDHRQSCDEDITDASCSDSGRSSVTVEIEDFTNSALMQFWHDQSCQSFTQLEGSHKMDDLGHIKTELSDGITVVKPTCTNSQSHNKSPSDSSGFADSSPWYTTEGEKTQPIEIDVGMDTQEVQSSSDHEHHQYMQLADIVESPIVNLTGSQAELNTIAPHLYNMTKEPVVLVERIANTQDIDAVELTAEILEEEHNSIDYEPSSDSDDELDCDDANGGERKDEYESNSTMMNLNRATKTGQRVKRPLPKPDEVIDSISFLYGVDVVYVNDNRCLLVDHKCSTIRENAEKRKLDVLRQFQIPKPDKPNEQLLLSAPIKTELAPITETDDKEKENQQIPSPPISIKLKLHDDGKSASIIAPETMVIDSLCQHTKTTNTKSSAPPTESKPVDTEETDIDPTDQQTDIGSNCLPPVRMKITIYQNGNHAAIVSPSPTVKTENLVSPSSKPEANLAQAPTSTPSDTDMSSLRSVSSGETEDALLSQAVSTDSMSISEPSTEKFQSTVSEQMSNSHADVITGVESCSQTAVTGLSVQKPDMSHEADNPSYSDEEKECTDYSTKCSGKRSSSVRSSSDEADGFYSEATIVTHAACDASSEQPDALPVVNTDTNTSSEIGVPIPDTIPPAIICTRAGMRAEGIGELTILATRSRRSDVKESHKSKRRKCSSFKSVSRERHIISKPTISVPTESTNRDKGSAIIDTEKIQDLQKEPAQNTPLQEVSTKQNIAILDPAKKLDRSLVVETENGVTEAAQECTTSLVATEGKFVKRSIASQATSKIADSQPAVKVAPSFPATRSRKSSASQASLKVVRKTYTSIKSTTKEQPVILKLTSDLSTACDARSEQPNVLPVVNTDTNTRSESGVPIPDTIPPATICTHAGMRAEGIVEPTIPATAPRRSDVKASLKSKRRKCSSFKSVSRERHVISKPTTSVPTDSKSTDRNKGSAISDTEKIEGLQKEPAQNTPLQEVSTKQNIAILDPAKKLDRSLVVETENGVTETAQECTTSPVATEGKFNKRSIASQATSKISDLQPAVKVAPSFPAKITIYQNGNHAAIVSPSPTVKTETFVSPSSKPEANLAQVPISTPSDTDMSSLRSVSSGETENALLSQAVSTDSMSISEPSTEKFQSTVREQMSNSHVDAITGVESFSQTAVTGLSVQKPDMSHEADNPSYSDEEKECTDYSTKCSGKRSSSVRSSSDEADGLYSEATIVTHAACDASSEQPDVLPVVNMDTNTSSESGVPIPDTIPPAIICTHAGMRAEGIGELTILATRSRRSDVKESHKSKRRKCSSFKSVSRERHIISKPTTSVPTDSESTNRDKGSALSNTEKIEGLQKEPAQNTPLQEVSTKQNIAIFVPAKKLDRSLVVETESGVTEAAQECTTSPVATEGKFVKQSIASQATSKIADSQPAVKVAPSFPATRSRKSSAGQASLKVERKTYTSIKSTTKEQPVNSKLTSDLSTDCVAGTQVTKPTHRSSSRLSSKPSPRSKKKYISSYSKPAPISQKKVVAASDIASEQQAKTAAKRPGKPDYRSTYSRKISSFKSSSDDADYTVSSYTGPAQDLLQQVEPTTVNSSKSYSKPCPRSKKKGIATTVVESSKGSKLISEKVAEPGTTKEVRRLRSRNTPVAHQKSNKETELFQGSSSPVKECAVFKPSSQPKHRTLRFRGTSKLSSKSVATKPRSGSHAADADYVPDESGDERESNLEEKRGKKRKIKPAPQSLKKVNSMSFFSSDEESDLDKDDPFKFSEQHGEKVPSSASDSILIKLPQPDVQRDYDIMEHSILGTLESQQKPDQSGAKTIVRTYARRPKCEKCSKKFPSARALADHTRQIHMNSGDLTCLRCDYHTPDSEQLRKHCAQVHFTLTLQPLHGDRQLFYCMSCDTEPYGDRLELKSHTISEHGYAYCEGCKERRTAYFTEEYQIHSYTHGKTKCKLCYDWLLNDELSEHMKTKHLHPEQLREIKPEPVLTTSSPPEESTSLPAERLSPVGDDGILICEEEPLPVPLDTVRAAKKAKLANSKKKALESQTKESIYQDLISSMCTKGCHKCGEVFDSPEECTQHCEQYYKYVCGNKSNHFQISFLCSPSTYKQAGRDDAKSVLTEAPKMSIPALSRIVTGNTNKPVEQDKKCHEKLYPVKCIVCGLRPKCKQEFVNHGHSDRSVVYSCDLCRIRDISRYKAVKHIKSHNVKFT